MALTWLRSALLCGAPLAADLVRTTLDAPDRIIGARRISEQGHHRGEEREERQDVVAWATRREAFDHRIEPSSVHDHPSGAGHRSALRLRTLPCSVLGRVVPPPPPPASHLR